MAEHNRQTLDRVNQHNQNADRIRQERDRIEQYRHQRRQMQPQHSQPQYQHPYNDRVIIRIINGRQVIQYIQGY